MSARKAKKIKSGRKAIDPEKKVQKFSTYLTEPEKDKIVNKYGSITQSVREEVLPKLVS